MDKSKITVVGIDASIRSTGVSWSTGGLDPSVRTFKAANIPDKDVISRMRRFEDVICRMNGFLKDLAPQVILIENYAFGAKFNREVMGEFGGLLRWHLIDHTNRVYEVSPMSLKLFVAGKGNANKDLVQAWIQKRWDKIFSNNDEADAYGLCRLGMAGLGWEECGKAQSRAVEKVFGDSLADTRLLGSGETPAF